VDSRVSGRWYRRKRNMTILTEAMILENETAEVFVLHNTLKVIPNILGVDHDLFFLKILRFKRDIFQ
jgi:hypothetical protein